MMTVLRRLLKYTFRVVLVLFTFVVLVMVLLYVPAVQNYVKEKAEQYVNKNLHLNMSVGRILLKFPLDLSLEKMYLGYPNRDTLLYADAIRVNVSLPKLLRKEIEVRRLAVNNASMHFLDTLSGLDLKIAVKDLNLRVNRLNLAKQEADIPMLSMRNGKMSLTLGQSKADTTGGNTPVKWKFKVEEVALDSVDYEMDGLPMGIIRAGVGKAQLKDTEVRLEEQTVDVNAVSLEQGYCELLMKTSEPQPVVKKDSVESPSWTVRVNKVELTDNRFLMKPINMPVSQEKFPEAIRISSLSIEMDSVFNRGTEVAAIIQDLKFKEESGLDLRNLSCRIHAGKEEVDVSNLTLKTAYSQLILNVQAESGITDFKSDTPFDLMIDGNIAGRDVLLFMPDTNAQLKGWLQDKEFTLVGQMKGMLDRLDITRLEVSAGNDFLMKGGGYVAFVTDMERLSGNLNLQVSLNRGAFFAPMLPKGMEERLVIPDGLSFKTELRFENKFASALLDIKLRDGRLNLNAGYGLKDQVYRADLTLEAFTLDAFMPKDSLGTISATLLASGKGFDLIRGTGKVNLDLKSLIYRGYHYKDIVLSAGLEDGTLNGELKSENKELDLDINFHLLADEEKYKVDLSGDVRNVDLMALHFSPSNLAFSLGIAVTGELNADSTASLQADFSNIVLQDKISRSLGNIGITLASLRERTDLDIMAGDFNLKFKGAGTGISLINKFSTVGELLNTQLSARDFDMEKLREVLPDFQLDISAARSNVLNSYLKSSGVRFNRLAVNMGSSASTGFGLNTAAYGLNVNGILIDSLLVRAYQEKIALQYAVDVHGAQDQLEGFAQLFVEGSVEHDQVNVRVREQEDEEGEIFNIGANIAFQDSAFTVSLAPDPLVLGYVSWQVNRGNYIRIVKGEIPSANLKLLNGDKRIRLVSEEGSDHKPESLGVDIKGVDLGHISRVISFIPDMSGLLSIDLQMHSKNEVIDVSGNLTIDEFDYQRERIGNIGVGIKYRLSQQTEHDVDVTLSVDGVEALSTKGKVMTGADDKNMDLDVNIPKLPLRVAGAFTPPGIVRLSGDLAGAFQIKGQLDKPIINGHVRFKAGEVEALSVGTTFTIDSSLITVHDNLLQFNKFGLIAPNKQRMELEGSVNFASFSDIHIDASVSAKNFQAMKVAENSETLVYGKVYIDLSATVKGLLDALKIRGNVALLDNSVINYALKSSPLSVTDKSIDVVRFVSFRDTTLVEQDDSLRQIRSVSLDLLMSVNIAPLVNLNLLLSDNGQNRVSINGGGDLTYSLNPVGETRLVGRYVLTSGIVSYGLPVIGQKDFNIQDGSFVEWTGDLANPTLNIVAAESISASVSEDNQNSRLVTFNAMIRIMGVLQKPDITFDLSAVGDISIQNQLAAMTPEERSKEAMNLMIYGSYSGPGTVAKSNTSDNAINSFVEKELNQWSRKYLKNMDLTFGINTYNQLLDGGESKKTDYSYQFSKRLFNNRVRVKVGGRISTDNDPAQGGVEENLVDDVSVEYVFGKNPNFFLKIFRHTGYESVLEGEVTQTGIGIVYRKKFQKVLDIFRRKKKESVEHPKKNVENEKSNK